MTTKIIGTGSAVPEQVVTNDDLAKVVETSDEWIRTRTGIRERRIATEESGTSHMAAEAARKALENAGISAEELDIIVLATSSADCCFPSGACEVQAAIGASRAVAFDLSAACSGFVYALNTVHSFFKAGIYKTGLVIGADTLSKLIDWNDRSTCVLFGDGAGAAVVRASESGSFHMTMGADGTRGGALACPGRTTGNFLTEKGPELGYMTMDGQEVFKFAVKTVPESINKVLAESETGIEEIKYFILHQANYRIFESIAKRLKIPMEKLPTNLERFGNTSGATIPILLDEMNREGKLQQGDKLILAGFGAGLTWGATLLEW
ncbi:MAG: beta-ketoacyl-ACP synthase III [Lacrimispora sp.]|uniref:beta-ketoacyl-ACP synthase III n=1 Tax=Lacrimispora sp. TaxID=2719234 RepID=UPI0039E29B06